MIQQSKTDSTLNIKESLPEKNREECNMQGHWLLAKMGKRVLRPGGLLLTRKMLAALDIGKTDSVVEFAPGLGVTARMTLDRHPFSYTAIEQNEAAAEEVRKYLQETGYQCHTGSAENTGLADGCATVVYGEAMLTMHPDHKKREIVREAARILKQGGRYGIHEVGLIPDDIDSSLKKEIQKELSRSIHIGASPLTLHEWQQLLESEGLTVKTIETEPFHLLEPKRLITDEGFLGALKFAANLMRNTNARNIVLDMKNVFRKYKTHMNGMVMVALKP